MAIETFVAGMLGGVAAVVAMVAAALVLQLAADVIEKRWYERYQKED
jgi:formiminotetrahydrofolate cyclodeaminase